MDGYSSLICPIVVQPVPYHIGFQWWMRAWQQLHGGEYLAGDSSPLISAGIGHITKRRLFWIICQDLSPCWLHAGMRLGRCEMSGDKWLCTLWLEMAGMTSPQNSPPTAVRLTLLNGGNYSSHQSNAHITLDLLEGNTITGMLLGCHY